MPNTFKPIYKKESDILIYETFFAKELVICIKQKTDYMVIQKGSRCLVEMLSLDELNEKLKKDIGILMSEIKDVSDKTDEILENLTDEIKSLQEKIEKSSFDWYPPSTKMPNVISKNCQVCGIDMESATNYVCINYNCPSRVICKSEIQKDGYGNKNQRPRDMQFGTTTSTTKITYKTDKNTHNED